MDNPQFAQTLKDTLPMLGVVERAEFLRDTLWSTLPESCQRIFRDAMDGIIHNLKDVREKEVGTEIAHQVWHKAHERRVPPAPWTRSSKPQSDFDDGWDEAMGMIRSIIENVSVR